VATFWLLQVDLAGTVIAEVGLPQEILACRTASAATGTLGSGFEGVAVLPDEDGGYRLLVAQQRGWDYTTPECEGLDDDAGGLNANGEPNQTRLWIYHPRAGTWDQVAWDLAPLPTNASWVGLSEITRAPDGSYVALERDNRTGDFAGLKTLVKVRHDALADGLISNGEKSVYDMMPDVKATNGWITDKPEGVAITGDGRTVVVSDNDGVEVW
jgi:Esterase-like activity of phytase